MFETVKEESTLNRLLDLLVAVWRSRRVRIVMSLALLVMLMVFGSWIWVWSASKSETCRTIVVPEMDFDSVMSLRARKSAYQRSRELTPWLELSPEEMTYLLSQSRGPVRIGMTAIGATSLKVQIGYPVKDGCYNIDLEGSVSVDDGRLVVLPQRVVVGGYDLTWMSYFSDIEVSPSDIPDSDISAQLENTRAMRVEDGALRLRLKDRSLRWRFTDE